jgi:hypothetical protein
MTQLTVHLDGEGNILIRAHSEDDDGDLVIQVDPDNAERLASSLELAADRAREVQTLFADVDAIFTSDT